MKRIIVLSVELSPPLTASGQQSNLVQQQSALPTTAATPVATVMTGLTVTVEFSCARREPQPA